ncbi:MAG: DUF6502 family protein [Gammaproteobacteria bacterium]
MQNNTDSVVVNAIRRFLPSVIRLALRGGINGRQFVDLVKESYVDVVTEDYGRSGRPTNIARTALLTGLSRNDVKRIRVRGDLKNPSLSSDKKRYGLGTLLREWHTNTSYLNAEGEPIALSFDGEEPSFSMLARRFFSDVPATTTLRELIETGAVRKDENDRIVALRDYFLPAPGNVQNTERMGGLIADFVGTVSYNLQRSEQEPSRIEIRTTEENIACEHEPAFRRVLEREATKFYRRIERWLKDKKEFETSDDEETTRLGFGVYQISGGGTEDTPDD